MNKHKGALPIPPMAMRDTASRELLRVWAAEGSQQISLAADIWEDPAAWGILLADLARHAANAISKMREESQSTILARIKEGFDVEWEHPTDEPA